MTTGPLSERRDRIVADLEALDTQVAAGEIDPETSTALRRRYEVELADTLAEIDTASQARPKGRSRKRVAVGLVAFAVAAAGVVFTLSGVVESSPTTTTAPVDLASVTTEEMEAVVAANPDVTPMRLALARRYVEAGEFSAALPHYMYVLDQGPDPEALMYVGWMTYLSGDAPTGAALIERSLEIRPGDPLAEWFLANARFYGLEDREGAVPLLDAVIAADGTPADIVAEAERMIAEASGS